MIALADATTCGCGSPKPSGGGCSCQAASRSDCACSRKRKPPGSATCCKAGGACTCANGLRSPPPHAKADVDPIHVGMLGAPLARRPDELEPPPVVVPRYCVIRCDPPHRELRPPKSFLDCRWYLLTSGGVGARPWVVEPPQSTELERDREEPFRIGPVQLDTYEDRAPIPVVATSDEGAASCSPGRNVAVARFTVASVCDAAGHKNPAAVQPPLAPGQAAARGKGGGSPYNPCYCECTCRWPWSLGFGRSFFDSTDPFTTSISDREPGEPRGPARIVGNEPLTPPMIDPMPPGLGGRTSYGPFRVVGGQPRFPPLIDPEPPRGGGRGGASRGPVRSAGNEPLAPPLIDPWLPWVLSPDARPENVAESRCEFCGQVRAQPHDLPQARPPLTPDHPQTAGERGREPPQIAQESAPVTAAELTELGTHSHGGTALAPPAHSDGARFISPSGASARPSAPRKGAGR